MRKLRFTAEAAADLQSLIDYGLTMFGADAALTYVEALEARIGRLVAHPDIGVLRQDLPNSPRSFSSDSHIIYYFPAAENVAILRIVHGSCDPMRHL